MLQVSIIPKVSPFLALKRVGSRFSCSHIDRLRNLGVRFVPSCADTPPVGLTQPGLRFLVILIICDKAANRDKWTTTRR